MVEASVVGRGQSSNTSGEPLTWLVGEGHQLLFDFDSVLPGFFFFLRGCEKCTPMLKRCFGNLTENHSVLPLPPVREPEGGAGLNGSGAPPVPGQLFW